ncbi:odorant receptor 49b-like [Microplitis demolitor]|uniref:odorant receptor 49b-like n=1 Tax=Microplitis demolitor TaxID=69319 RepID=UPI0004CCEC28|nr:odorant receptor 49b-like [Microplitis demolitor]
MLFKATPEFAIAFTKLTSILGSSWPHYKNATKFQLIVFNIKWWFFWFMSITAFLPMCYAAYNNTKNILSFTKSLCDAANCSQAFIKMLLCKIHYRKLQFLFYEMEKYVEQARAHERELFISYIKRSGRLHVSIMISAVMAAVIIIMAPIGMPQPFPNVAEYPFPVDGHPTFEIIYMQQSIATIHCMSIPVFDCQIALLLWYAGARLELLGDEFQKVADNQQFIACVKKHQYLLWFIQEIIMSSRYILATTVVMCTIAVITSGVHIVGNEPVADKVPFVILSMGLSAVLYLCAWPSEHLAQMCENIGNSLYHSSWIKNTKELNKSIFIVIQRSQKPATIEVAGILPMLSLPYYATFLSKTFSYFTTLRVVLDKMEE